MFSGFGSKSTEKPDSSDAREIKERVKNEAIEKSRTQEVVAEAMKESTASRNLDVSQPIMDNTTIANKIGLEVEADNAREHRRQES